MDAAIKTWVEIRLPFFILIKTAPDTIKVRMVKKKKIAQNLSIKKKLGSKFRSISKGGNAMMNVKTANDITNLPMLILK